MIVTLSSPRSGFHASDDINHLEAQTAEAGTVLVGQGDVTIRAGDNVTARAATVSSEGGLLAVDAVRGDITLQAGVATSLREDARVAVHEGTFKTRTTLTRERAALTQAVGSAFSGQTLLLKAGQDIHILASDLSAQDQMQIDAGRDLQLGTFTAYTDTSYQRHSFQRANGLGRLNGFSFNSAGLFDVGYSFLKKASEDQLRTQRSTQAQGSTISAGSLSTSSGRDTTLVGATVAIENDLRMHAGGNLSLLAAEQTQSDYSRTHSYANGQIGSWWQPAMGTAQQGEQQRGSSTTHLGTQVASLKGSIALSADGQYVQTGSTVAAPEGDIHIRASEVQIDAAFDRGESTQSGSSSRSALGGTVSIPLVSVLVAITLLPVALAQPLLRAILLCEHTGCSEDDDAYRNTRTTHTVLPVRFFSAFATAVFRLADASGFFFADATRWRATASTALRTHTDGWGYDWSEPRSLADRQLPGQRAGR